jgi:hypothetical protein
MPGTELVSNDWVPGISDGVSKTHMAFIFLIADESDVLDASALLILE